jgi:hypothetical protein
MRQTLNISAEDLIDHGRREQLGELELDILPSPDLIEVNPAALSRDAINIKESLIVPARVRRTGSIETGINRLIKHD